MTLDEIRQSRDHAPFEPFKFVLVDGSVFQGQHRDCIFVPPGRGAWAYIADPKSSRVEHINTFVISSVRRSGENGAGRSRKKKAS